MNYFSALITASLTTGLLGFTAITGHAQSAFASTTAPADANTGYPAASYDSAPPAAPALEEVVLTGKITNPAGVLPGAVIILTDSKQMAVTNADGEFQFTVPASAGPLQAVVTYAGYADERMTLNAAANESTVNLANATVIVVSRKQQLKAYLKTARKQIKRDLRRARKAA